MNAHALTVLEFARVRELAAGRAASEAGARRVRSLEPSADPAWVELEHTRVSAMLSIVESEAGWRSSPIPGLEGVFDRLRLPGSVLGSEELRDIGQLLVSARLTRSSIRQGDRPVTAVAVLQPYTDALLIDSAMEEAIRHVIAEDGSVRDDASPALRRIRRELRESEGKLVAMLERIISHLDAHQRVPDMSVTVRNGRYVIPVRREGRAAVGGMVHDSSQTGATLFVEPPAAIEACNRIREMEADELREVDRLLAHLTDRVRPHADGLRASRDALAALDGLYGRARFAQDFRCAPVQLRPPGSGLVLKGARHPLLLDQGIAVVPFDLEMETGERTLLVSGPNTGGKTVLLKTIGLLSAMLQAGIPVPLSLGSALPMFDDVFADVGDEQSIEASLSTFSAHLKNIAEILHQSTGHSLVLLDELGSGTDPLEGAALGGAVIEALAHRGCRVVATTHLGALKELAGELPAVINASLQFDADRLSPTFQLSKGIPGRSYGLRIARRLGLPADVVARAEERVPRVERDVNALLESLERREVELRLLEARAAASHEGALETAHRLASREDALRKREIAFEREARQGARRYLLEARHEVERTIQELKGTSPGEVEEAASRARKQIEDLAESERKGLVELDRTDERQEAGGGTPGPLSPGTLVVVHPLNGRIGRVLEPRGEGFLVAVGVMKMTFPADAVSPAPPQSLASAPALRGDLPDESVASEIDIRGMRADESEEFVLQAIDAAVRADLRSLRIIHGKGTGALRERVAGMLKKDTRVRAFRSGAWNEGGSGVTLVEL